MSENAPLLIGCDVGTSSTKAILVSSAGQMIARASSAHAMTHPRPGWSETAPMSWWDSAAETIRAVASATDDPSAILGLAVVAQREPAVLLARGEVLHPAISWTDRRAHDELQEVIGGFGRQSFIQATGMAPNVGMTLAHLLWLRRNRPQVWAAADEIVLAKDFVLHRLCGRRLGTDHTTPSRSGLLSVDTPTWDDDVLAAFELDHATLPAIEGAPWHPVGLLDPEVADALGLPRSLMVARGGSDDAAAALGGGAVDAGEVCIGTGTATDFRTVLLEPAVDPTGLSDLSPHVVPERYLRETAIESTGSSLHLFLDSLLPEAKAAELFAEAALIEPGAAGLTVLPFVDGAARAPFLLADGKGAVLGIVSGHSPAHFVRAVLEGVAFEYKETLSAIGPVHEPAVIGDGEARIDLWNQIKADVTNLRLKVPVVVELAAAGAAILAGMAAGVFGSAGEGVGAIVRADHVVEPDNERHERYQELAVDYLQAFEALRPRFAAHVA